MEGDEASEAALAWAAAKRSGVFFLAAGAIHLGARAAFRRGLGERRLAAMKRHDRLNVAELVVSTAHGLASGGMGLALVAGGAWAGDVFAPYPALADTLFACLTGYAAWDTAVMVFMEEPAAMWLHHALVIFGAFAMQVYREAAFFPALFAVSELTVVPTNALWYAQKVFGEPRDGPRARFLRFVRALFYVVLRLPLGPYAVYHAVSTTPGGLSGVAARFAGLHLVVSGGTAMNVGLLTVLNVLWTRGAVASALRRASTGKRKPL